MSTLLNVLFLEDRADDLEPIIDELQRAGFELVWRRVFTEETYLESLHGSLDIIIADYMMPQFNAQRALKLLNECTFDIPFIVVTGAVSEEVAVDCLKMGAADYLLKDRLTRLGEAVRNAMREKKLRAEQRRIEIALQENEAWLRTILNNSPVLCFVLDEHGNFKFADGKGLDHLDFAPSQLIGQSAWSAFGETLPGIRLQFQRALAGETVEAIMQIGGRAFDVRYSSLFGEEVPTRDIVGVATDITRRKRAEDELVKLNQQLELRIADRTAELEAANQQLMELDHLKSKFVGDVSHELRTPIANLQLRLDLLKMDDIDQQDSHLSAITQSVLQLERLVNDILDLSRLEEVENDQEMEPLDVNGVVRRVLEDQSVRIADKGLELVISLDESIPLVVVDQNLFSQVVTNLTSNSINYTEHGKVVVETAYDKRMHTVCISVQDSGIGIAEEELSHIFDRFYRSSQVSRSAIRGTGLGLSIVQEIVDMHHGKIFVESQLGVGTTFKVCFPVAE